MKEEFLRLKNQLGQVIENENLAPYTSFKIGGPAKYFIKAKSNNDIIKAISVCRDLDIPFFILGNGTNILISDQGFKGLVLKLENDQITFKDKLVSAESGVKLQKLIRFCIAKNLTGLENLIGIPGTVGGAVAGNVGTQSKWIEENIIQVEILNSENKVLKIPKTQCDFNYRNSRFKYNDNEIILCADFELKKSSQNEIQKNVKKYLQSRNQQPINQACAGSIFKNPEGQKAWQVIDQIGFRGKVIGGAKVSEKHANFIINSQNAKAEDVVILISLIKQQARDQLGIQLQEEIKYIGF